MKVITLGLLLLLCALVTAEQEAPSDKNERSSGDDVKEGSDDRTVQEDVNESGSSPEIESEESSADPSSSGSGNEDEEEESQPQMTAPKPMKFRYIGFRGFRGPVTITPMEPMINRQKPFRRRCFFCFPRGRLGRVELTAPGGPYLMNGFGPINGYGPLDGFGMEYPGIGLPETGPEFPAVGGFGGPCCGGPCCGGPCYGDGPCSGDGPNQGPMIFEGINEEAPKKPPVKIQDKQLQQVPNKGIAPPPNKVMVQAPNKGEAHIANKVMDQVPNKGEAQISNKVMDQVPNKGEAQISNKVMDQVPNKEEAQISNKVMDQVPNKGEAQVPNKVMDQVPNKAGALSPNKLMDQGPNQAPNKVASNEPIKNDQTEENKSDKTSATNPKDEE